MSPTNQIAINITLLYTILGPLLIFAIYVLFDSLYGSDSKQAGLHGAEEKDPALWNNEEIDRYMEGF